MVTVRTASTPKAGKPRSSANKSPDQAKPDQDKQGKKDKPPKTKEEIEAAAKKKAAQTAANVKTQAYIDKFNTSSDCNNDKTEISKHCAPKPEAQKKDEKTRKGGVLRHIRQVMAKADELGQKYYKYSKGTPANNTWMDDHCDGMWIKPQFSGMKGVEEEVAKFKKELSTLGATVNSWLANPGIVAEAAYSQLVTQAVEKMGYEQVRDMVLKKFGKDALVSLLPVGKAGAIAKLGTVAKIGFEASGYIEMGEKLVAAVGTAHARELLQGMKFLLKDAQKRLGDLLKVWEEKPDAVMAELMSINAEFDRCLRARKCQLVPYKSNNKSNVSKGEGCCSGQTPHHVIPHSAAKDAGCDNYTYGGAPTICLEGQDNTYGSHGRAHTKLDVSVKNYNGESRQAKPIDYGSMRDKSLDAIKESTEPHCSQTCLAQQLDAYYTHCKDLVAKSGKGGAPGTDEEGKGGKTGGTDTTVDE